MIEIWHIEKDNAAGMFAQSVDSNGADLPPALPWVEPSLNNLWLEACSSHLCGNYQAAIITTSVLLEFTLRMVVSNLDEVPSIRKDHGEMFENQTLRPVINSAKVKGFCRAIQRNGGKLTASIFETRFAMAICCIFLTTAEMFLSSLIISIP